MAGDRRTASAVAAYGGSDVLRDQPMIVSPMNGSATSDAHSIILPM
jgi:hypothetical protein